MLNLLCVVSGIIVDPTYFYYDWIHPNEKLGHIIFVALSPHTKIMRIIRIKCNLAGSVNKFNFDVGGLPPHPHFILHFDKVCFIECIS